MLKNYLTIAIRNLIRHKGYSLINVIGLAVGMACCIVILLYVQDEISYDRYHKHAAQIFRVVTDMVKSGDTIAQTPFPLAPALANEFPEVRRTTRLLRYGFAVRHGGQFFLEKGFIFADSTVFDVFTWPLLKGDPRTALRDPDAVVLTDEMAHKYFGEDDPIGKILTICPGAYAFDLKVTGIIHLPRNSHLHFDFLAPLPIMQKRIERYEGSSSLENWWNTNFSTYLVLAKDYPPAALEQKLPEFLERHRGKGVSSDVKLHLQPLTAIHLYSAHIKEDLAERGDIAQVSLFSAIAGCILLIACLNVMVLSTARSTTRAKEVGIRKVIGAQRRQLITQFVGESLVLVVLTLPLAAMLVELLLPAINTLSGKALTITSMQNGFLLVGPLGLTVGVGILSSIYPAFYVSVFPPVDVLKGTLTANARGAWFRKSLVVLQFGISIALLTSTGMIYRQLSYLSHKNLGFRSEHVVVLPSLQPYIPFKHALLQHANILAVSGASHVPPTRDSWLTPVRSEDNPAQEKSIENVHVDDDFLETLGIEMAAGRSFSKHVPTDATEAFLLNETAIREFGWSTPEGALGKRLQLWKQKGTVIGVVKDVHLRSLHTRIEPMIFHIDKENLRRLVVRVRSDHISETLALLETTWQRFVPERPFEYEFLDERLESIYRSEQRLEQIIGAFAGLAVSIACLGLFGLASFTAEQRTKEIGVRKVLGASVTSIVLLLSKEFAKLVLVANVIAWPIAYYAMNRWLQDFAYRIEIGWETFVLGGMLALAIALLTVSFQAIRAALANPVEALRYE